MYDHGFGCEEKHLEDMDLSEEFFEKMDELIAEESKKYIVFEQWLSGINPTDQNNPIY